MIIKILISALLLTSSFALSAIASDSLSNNNNEGIEKPDAAIKQELLPEEKEICPKVENGVLIINC